MARLLSLLAIVLLFGHQSLAISLVKDEKSCEQLNKYDGRDAGFEVVVTKKVDKDFPSGYFSASCVNAQITPTDKGSATVRVVFIAECAEQVFSSNPKPGKYKCVNENSEHVGDHYYEMTATVSCFNKPNGFPCIKVDSITDVTPKQAAPSPPKVGVWIPTPVDYVTKDIQKAALEYMMQNVKSTSVAPSQNNPNAQPIGPSRLGDGFSRKIDTNGVTYRINALLNTKSAAKGCNFPFLESQATVDVKKAAGKYSFSNLIESKYEKFLTEDTGARDKCVGKPAWKAGVAKIEKFCKTVKGGCTKVMPLDK